jgi:CRISPR-associated protein Csx3
MHKNDLPAVLIGGPPHAGKSVLFYSITTALNKRSIPHHAIRACPDGEGNWAQEGDAQTVSHIRNKNKGAWSDEFVQRICQNLEHRCFPFLVDMGAYPTPAQQCMLQSCTHAILLLRADKPEDTQFWQSLVAENNLKLLAQITSQTDGASASIMHDPVLEGTLVGLERYEGIMAQGPVFEALIERIATLFNACMPQDLERFHRENAPTQLLDLYDVVPLHERWEPAMLRSFLSTVPTMTPISIYGKAPGWVYAAIAATNALWPLYQFDPRFHNGWVQSLAVAFGDRRIDDLAVDLREYEESAMLHLNIRSKHLEYLQPESLCFPRLSTNTGLILDGAMPYWLLTSLVRLYKEAGVSWIAYRYVQMEGKAVVVYSQHPSYQVGDLVIPPVQF